MRIETTVQEVRALLLLQELDAEAQELPPETYRRRREVSGGQVARALLERYQALHEAGRRPVIVAIERGGCSGCHVRLPTMVAYQARHSPTVHTCPQCRRMVYAPELLGEDSRAAVSKTRAVVRPATPSSAGERS